MTDRDFRTAAEARAEARAARVAAAEGQLEDMKRAVESALADYPRGSRERGEVLRFCDRIGLEISESAGAGVEFTVADLEAAAHRLETTAIPASLKRHLG